MQWNKCNIGHLIMIVVIAFLLVFYNICRVLSCETANLWLLLLAGAAERAGSSAVSQRAVLLDGRSGRYQGRGTYSAEWETR